jgi:hypothetical protein
MSTKIIEVPGDGITAFTQFLKTYRVPGSLILLLHGMLAEIRTIIISKQLPICLYANKVGKVPLKLIAPMIEPEPA